MGPSKPNLNLRHQRFWERHRHAARQSRARGAGGGSGWAEGQGLLYCRPLHLAVLPGLCPCLSNVPPQRGPCHRPQPAPLVLPALSLPSRTSQVQVLLHEILGPGMFLNPESQLYEVTLYKIPAGGSPPPHVSRAAHHTDLSAGQTRSREEK